METWNIYNYFEEFGKLRKTELSDYARGISGIKRGALFLTLRHSHVYIVMEIKHRTEGDTWINAISRGKSLNW